MNRSRIDVQQRATGAAAPPADACAIGAHVAPAEALYRPGVHRCVRCGIELDVPVPLIEEVAGP